jgi:hypothetical protein
VSDSRRPTEEATESNSNDRHDWQNLGLKDARIPANFRDNRETGLGGSGDQFAHDSPHRQKDQCEIPIDA